MDRELVIPTLPPYSHIPYSPLQLKFLVCFPLTLVPHPPNSILIIVSLTIGSRYSYSQIPIPLSNPSSVLPSTLLATSHSDSKLPCDVTMVFYWGKIINHTIGNRQIKIYLNLYFQIAFIYYKSCPYLEDRPSIFKHCLSASTLLHIFSFFLIYLPTNQIKWAGTI